MDGNPTGIQVRHLVRTFGDRTALNDVSFDVAPGQMTGFVGGNGAGKTTTMRIMMGVLEATSGTVTKNGVPLDLSARRRFGYMPEERGLYPKQRIVDQLVYLAELRGINAQSARQEILELLERFNLADRAKDKLEKLSLGNQQRVQIIASVVGQPEALVLDEPFSGLDPQAVNAMADLLREHTARGVPVLFSSHQLDLVDRLCDNLVILADGEVVGFGTSDELRERAVKNHRLVMTSDVGWVREQPDIDVLDVDGNAALLHLRTSDAGRELLAEAMRRGEVLEYGPRVATLSEIYTEAVA